jgi:beta-glucosidase
MDHRFSQNSPLRSPDFLFGTATSAYQIEGAADQRLPCIWDTFSARPGKIADGSNANRACEHVARLEQDLDLLAWLGVDAYRFSISWPRVVKLDGSLNAAGADFYARLVDGLLKRNIQPFATLYHWDLPQHLEDLGGWLARDNAYRFQDYAELISHQLGDRVVCWATLNEPFCSAHLGYETGLHAPGLAERDLVRTAGHHLLLAHGLALQALRANCPGASLGIVLNFAPGYAASDSAADQQAVMAADIEHNQWYLQPLLGGSYPETLDDHCVGQMPEIHAGDLKLISQPIDFLGVNYYTRAVLQHAPGRPFAAVPPTGALTDMDWEIYPQGLTDLLVSLHRRYRLPPLYITENGAAMADQLVDGEVNDPGRIDYLLQHLAALEDAMAQGVDVRGYFCWSLMDNFEWSFGYSKRFGIVYVDFETQQRTVKASGHVFRALLESRAATSREDRAGQSRV